jgi:hypothetical protein
MEEFMQAFADQPNPPQRVLRILVACEFSGVVRDAFLEKGHDAWSCDLLPAEHNSNRHIRMKPRLNQHRTQSLPW